ncbi:hypothetical protein KKH36_01775 [Patescibacteria group bacterium]|nr:hypothetical protein [Patescibacteria group bacterium]
MLLFASEWSWQLKTFIAMIGVIVLLFIMPSLQEKGLKSESYLLFWFGGCFVSFLLASWGSSVSITEYLFPWKACLTLFVVAILVGGPANILLFQAMSTVGEKAVSNPAVPFAIVGGASSVAYIMSCLAGKIAPTIFPQLPFSWTIFFGLIFLFTGGAMVSLGK